MDREGQWVLIFQHHLEQEGDLFTSDDEALSCNTANKLSFLKEIEKKRDHYLISGKFYFRLEYPGIEGMNYWRQSVFPTLAEPNSDIGYEDLGCSFKKNYWNGLGKSSSAATFIDGSRNASTWYYTIGQKVKFCSKYKLPDPRYDDAEKDFHYLTDTRLWIKMMVCPTANSKCTIILKIPLIYIMLLCSNKTHDRIK